MDLTPDAVVGKKYRLLRKLSESSRGAVFLATHGNTERKLTLEVVRRGADPAAPRVKPVSRASNHVAHRGLVEVLESGSDGGREWLALELMRGETLAKRLESGPLEAAVLRFVFTRLLEIVAHVHRAGIVHGHLAPERVFLEETAAGLVRVRLLDFELVPHGEQLLGTHSAASAAVVVPRAYQAPEQRGPDGVLSAATDVFALGAVLVACLSSQRPLDLARLSARTAASTGELTIAIDEPALEPYAAVAGYCLAFEPERRPSSCEDLRRLFDMGGSRPPPLPRSVVAPARHNKRRGWLRLGALVLAGVLLALFIRRAAPTDAPPPSVRSGASTAEDDETSSSVRSRDSAEQNDPESAEEPSEEVAPEHSTIRSRVEEPLASTVSAAPLARPPKDQSEQIFASTEQSAPFADLRGRSAARPRRGERSYRLDVEGASITRSDTSDTSDSASAALSLKQVRDALRRSAGQLERCCDAALRASLDAQLRALDLAVSFSVEASGETRGVRMDGDASDELTACIRGAVQRWRLPGSEVGAQFRVGLEFASLR